MLQGIDDPGSAVQNCLTLCAKAVELTLKKKVVVVAPGEEDMKHPPIQVESQPSKKCGGCVVS